MLRLCLAAEFSYQSSMELFFYRWTQYLERNVTLRRFHKEDTVNETRITNISTIDTRYNIAYHQAIIKSCGTSRNLQ